MGPLQPDEPWVEVVRASYRDLQGRRCSCPDSVYALALNNPVTSNLFRAGTA